MNSSKFQRAASCLLIAILGLGVLACATAPGRSAWGNSMQWMDEKVSPRPVAATTSSRSIDQACPASTKASEAGGSAGLSNGRWNEWNQGPAATIPQNTPARNTAHHCGLTTQESSTREHQGRKPDGYILRRVPGAAAQPIYFDEREEPRKGFERPMGYYRLKVRGGPHQPLYSSDFQ